MIIAAVSDTHNHSYSVSPVDIFVHAGDLTVDGTQEELREAIKEIQKQPAIHKIVIAGNHDKIVENWNEFARELFSLAGIIYLQDEEVTVEGLRFYGSPYTLEYGYYSFMLPRVGGEAIKKWEKIPTGIDVLITHGPPWGRFDVPFGHYSNVGDPDLMRELQRVKPQAHIFGHIHSPGDVVGADGVRYINAAQCNIMGGRYNKVYEPITFELSPKGLPPLSS